MTTPPEKKDDRRKRRVSQLTAAGGRPLFVELEPETSAFLEYIKDRDGISNKQAVAESIELNATTPRKAKS